MIIKAISLWQPWATLMALKEKRFETRSWMTPHRGPLAIHATQRFPKEAQALCLQEPFKSVLERHGYTSPMELPRGAILAVGSLVRIDSTYAIRQAKFIGPNELAFGDYADGRYAWQVVDVEKLAAPIAVRGRQGLWNWEIPESLEIWWSSTIY